MLPSLCRMEGREGMGGSGCCVDVIVLLYVATILYCLTSAEWGAGRGRGSGCCVDVTVL